MTTLRILGPAALLALAAACTTEKTADDAADAPAATPAASADARVVTVHARDFAFQLPDTIEAGFTTLRLVNDGPDLHHVQLLRLDAGHTMDELMAAMRNPGPPPAWVHDVGGPNTPAPGDTAEAALDLAAGNYAVVCFIPAPDGMPHIMKGMAHGLVVKPAVVQVAAAAPTADTDITLDDYTFTLSRPLTAGHHTIRVTNQASQSHEVVLVKLAPGKTAQDVVTWVEKRDGPPPGTPLGGVTAIAQGVANYMMVGLEPGEYALLCFVPDAADGKPHVMHGMTQQFSVQ
ncbi:MAG TPA: hypothetical protein VFS08_16145 [Gemmatimonadaceae bacterium]|nr:hypothetical protein [Gemmatimonadaceae bacterium]